jgi:hypothetical protein
MNPLEKLDRSELVLLLDILKDACRERLEKNLLNQAFEDRLAKRGPLPGRVDPRPGLKRWEPRYRKLLEVAAELRASVRRSEAESIAGAFERVASRPRPVARVIPMPRPKRNRA